MSRTEFSGEEICTISHAVDDLIFRDGHSWFMANAAGRLHGKPTPTNLSSDSTGSLLIGSQCIRRPGLADREKSRRAPPGAAPDQNSQAESEAFFMSYS